MAKIQTALNGVKGEVRILVEQINWVEMASMNVQVRWVRLSQSIPQRFGYGCVDSSCIPSAVRLIQKQCSYDHDVSPLHQVYWSCLTNWLNWEKTPLINSNLWCNYEVKSIMPETTSKHSALATQWLINALMIGLGVKQVWAACLSHMRKVSNLMKCDLPCNMLHAQWADFSILILWPKLHFWYINIFYGPTQCYMQDGLD